MKTLRNQILLFVLIGLFSAGSGAQHQSLIPGRNGDLYPRNGDSTALPRREGRGKAKEWRRGNLCYDVMAAFWENSRKPAVLIRKHRVRLRPVGGKIFCGSASARWPVCVPDSRCNGRSLVPGKYRNPGALNSREASFHAKV